MGCRIPIRTCRHAAASTCMEASPLRETVAERSLKLLMFLLKTIIDRLY
jgi:hypothetical protein